MPATFPSHAGGVLPLKLLKPSWFDGVALVVGAAMPDLLYVGGCCDPPLTFGHSWWGTVAGVPFTIVLSWLIRWAAPVVAVHLPHLGVLALRDYGVLGVVRHRWWVSALSAWLGALSHVGWDHLTHASIPGTDRGLSALNAEMASGVAWWMPVHLLSTVLGTFAWLAVTLHVGRHRLLLRWHGPAPDLPAWPKLFWCIVFVAGLGGVVVVSVLAWLGSREAMVPFLAPVPRLSVLVVRAGTVLFLAILMAVAAVRLGARQADRTGPPGR